MSVHLTNWVHIPCAATISWLQQGAGCRGCAACVRGCMTNWGSHRLAGFLPSPGCSVVLDAEAVAFDRESNKVLPFQVRSQLRSRKPGGVWLPGCWRQARTHGVDSRAVQLASIRLPRVGVPPSHVQACTQARLPAPAFSCRLAPPLRLRFPWPGSEHAGAQGCDPGQHQGERALVGLLILVGLLNCPTVLKPTAGRAGVPSSAGPVAREPWRTLAPHLSHCLAASPLPNRRSRCASLPLTVCPSTAAHCCGSR